MRLFSKKRCFFCLFFILIFLLASCDGILEDAGNSAAVLPGSEGKDAELPDRASLFVDFDDKQTEVRGAVMQMTFDSDSEEDRKKTLKISCVYYKDNKETPGAWEFSSEDTRLYNIESSSCMMDCSSLALGMYTIKARSLFSPEFDKVFIVNAVSALDDVVIDYKIQDKYKLDGFAYDESMASGTITRYTREVVLISGASYDMTVRDASESRGIPVPGLTLSMEGDGIAVREAYGALFELVCSSRDGAQGTLDARVGNSDLGIKCKIITKDISESRLEEYDLALVPEKVISLVANSSDDPDRSYSYRIVTNSVLPDREVVFSVDYLRIGEEEERMFANGGRYSPDVNDDVHWFSLSTLSKTWELDGVETGLFSVECDGATGVFSITPRVDTVWTDEDGVERNLHCYLYVKYPEDAPEICRYRYRIMVGGCLEDVVMLTVDPESGEEQALDGDIAVREGDETGWILRASCVPTTTENTQTLWYLSDSKKEYLWQDKEGNSFKAPRPVDSGDIRNKVLNMMVRTGEEYAGLSDFICDALAGEFFSPVFYWLDDAEGGRSDLWCTYNSLGTDLVVVAFNTAQKIYACIAIKDLGDKQIIVKSLQGTAEPPLYDKGLSTGYSSGDTVQEYPMTVVEGHEGERTFYMKYDDNLVVEFSSSFKIQDMSAYGDIGARSVFPILDPSVSEDGLSGYLSLRTLLANEQNPSAERMEEIRRQCVQVAGDGVNVYVVFDTKYKVKLRIVIYG